MTVDASLKQEGGSEVKASSAGDTCSNGSSTVANTDQIVITGQVNPLKREPISALTQTSSTGQPASKRIKLEETTTASGNADVSQRGLSQNDNGAKAPLETGETSSVPMTQTQLPTANPLASQPASNAGEASTTATKEIASANKPQHSITPAIGNTRQEQSQGTGISSVASASCASGVKATSSSVPSNNQEGSSSVVTASIGSSPQHTSQSSSASADSSNGSLHDSEINRSTVASAPPATPIKNIPSSQPATAAVAKAAANEQNLKNPPVQASNPTPRTQQHQPQAQTKPPAKPVPPRSQIPAASVASKAPPASKTTSNAEVPLKSLNFGHLRIKYLGELEYMLREFRKLERQLLGAKGAQQLEESQGSRERREKLHSFILHLEDTIRQIEMGCKLMESEASAGDGATASEEFKKQLAQESALSILTKEKEEEETVQKLEEHILANLLPVKVRLKKQLAAQQGATQNPPGMPARRGSLQPSSQTRGKGTFVEAVEKKRKQAESLRLAAQVQHERQARREVSDPTQFGKPLSGVGSSLTKKLHGSTLGSKQRRTGHGVGSSTISKDTGERKILHAGMVPKSTQQKSGLSAASGVHDIVMSSAQTNGAPNNAPATAALASSISAKPVPAQAIQTNAKLSSGNQKRTTAEAKIPSKNVGETTKQNKQVVTSSSAPMSEEERLKYKKHRRLRKLKRLKRRRERELARQQLPKSQQHLPNNTQSAASAAVGRKKAGHGKVGQKKKGPRVVEYLCSQCSEAYTSTCEWNPWWALAQHKCPKCGKTQIPRIDITSPANAIEYHPALLSHLEDGGRGGAGSITASSAQAMTPTMPIVSQIPDSANSINSESDSDLSELSDDNISIGSLKAAELESELQSMTPAERAEHETFGKEYEGPVLADDHAAKLLILMGHASTCPCQHKSEKHREVCRSTKYMMLHVRDCPGTTATCDVCPFPWCRKVKHLLYHLVSCKDPDQCPICSPKDLPKGLQGLVGLNAHRTKKHRERLIALAKASQAAKNTKANQAGKKQSTAKRSTTGTQASSARKGSSDTKASVAKPISKIQRPAKASVPVKQETITAPVPAPAPFISATSHVTSVDKGIASSNRVNNPLVAQVHPAIAQPSTEDFDVDAEIAKLESVATDLNESIPYAIPIPEVKMEDADAAELNDLLATNSSSDDHAISNPVEQELGDISEYLKNDDQITSQLPPPQGSVPVTEHQAQIDMGSGVPDALVDPNSDPLANMNPEIVYESSDLVVPVAATELKEEYPEPVSAASASTPNAPDVETAAGSVAVN